MAYGLIAKTANDTFIIDGSSSNYRSLQPQAEQTVSNGGTFGYNAGELVFARKSSGTGSVYSDGSKIYGSNLRAFKAIPSNTFGSLSAGYGLRVFNQSGVLAYDSRNSAIGLEVVNIWAPGQLSGKRSTLSASTNTTIETGDILYEGSNIHDYSILLNGSIYQTSGNYPSEQFSSQFIWNGAYYDALSSPNKITWIGVASVIFSTSGTPSGGAANNLQSVILAKYIA